MFTGPEAFYDISHLILAAIDAELATTPYGTVPRVCVVPGELAWDECECGMLAASPQRFFLSDEFPQDALGRGLVRSGPCDLPFLIAEISITIARCAPQPPDGQLAPSCAALDLAAKTLLSDAFVVMIKTTEVLCELMASNEIVEYVLGEQVTRGPEGMCVGTELLAFAAIPRL